METRSSRLKTLINQLNISQKGFAEKANINYRLLSQYINGKQLGDKTANKIIKCYPNISLEWLMNGDGDMFVSDKNVLYKSSPPKKYDNNLINTADGDGGISKFEPTEGMVIHNNKSLEKLQLKINTAIEFNKVAVRKLTNSKFPLPQVSDLINESSQQLEAAIADIEKQKRRYSTLLKAALDESLKESRN